MSDNLRFSDILLCGDVAGVDFHQEDGSRQGTSLTQFFVDEVFQFGASESSSEHVALLVYDECEGDGFDTEHSCYLTVFFQLADVCPRSSRQFHGVLPFLCVGVE